MNGILSVRTTSAVSETVSATQQQQNTKSTQPTGPTCSHLLPMSTICTFEYRYARYSYPRRVFLYHQHGPRNCKLDTRRIGLPTGVGSIQHADFSSTSPPPTPGSASVLRHLRARTNPSPVATDNRHHTVTSCLLLVSEPDSTLRVKTQRTELIP